jgi:glycerol-3-phosphate dehydrogenase (NAD(P)+)
VSTLAILGGGSWGTALAIALAARFERVTLWVHEARLADEIGQSRENQPYLPGFRLPGNVTIGAPDPAASIVLGVMPSRFAREVYRAMPLPPAAPIVSATKGLEKGGCLRMSQVIEDVLPGHPVAVLSGPTFAREIAAGEPAAVVVASRDASLAERIQAAFATPRLRLYTNTDVVGVEMGAALKNVVAVGAGIVEGLGLGSNTRAALITRGLAEITRLAVAAGGRPETLAGLAGLGDLVLTCTGELSRNRGVGMELAKGRTIREVAASMKMVAEGVETTAVAIELGDRLGVDLPIARQVQRVISGTIAPRAAVEQLMERAPRPE